MAAGASYQEPTHTDHPMAPLSKAVGVDYVDAAPLTGCARMFPLPTKLLRAPSSFILMFATRLAAYTAGSNVPLLICTGNTAHRIQIAAQNGSAGRDPALD